MTTKLQRFCQELLPIIQDGAKGARIAWDVDVGSNPTEINANADYLTFESDRKYQIMREMIAVNGFQVAAGESFEPNNNAAIFWPDFEAGTLVEGTFWSGSALHRMMFDRGLVYLNKQHAIDRAKAMLGVGPYAKEQEE